MESLGIGSDCENEMCSCGSSCKHRFWECFKEPNVMFVFECSKQIKAREREGGRECVLHRVEKS